MNKIKLSPDEEKSLIGILYNHLTFGTSLEVFGELTQEGGQRLTQLRNAFGKLLKKYSLTDKLNPETYLLLGMTDFLNKSLLEKWSKNDKNKHLQNRAIFFLKKS